MEALPGGTALFAAAYQAQLKARGEGGDLTGQAAIQKLLEDMKKGKVTSDILTFAGARASTQANTGGALDLAARASQAEQARYQNTVNDLAVVASNAGVEEGFSRIFRTLNQGLQESEYLVKRLAEGFNDVTKFADDLLLFPQSFIRALEGRDSLVADWLGINQTKQLQEDWKNIKQIFDDLSKIEFNFLPDLEATAREVAKILNTIAEIQKFRAGNGPKEVITADQVETIDPFGTGGYKSPIGLAQAAGNNFLTILGQTGERRQRFQDKLAETSDVSSPYYNDPQGYDAMERDRALALADDKVSGIPNNNEITIQVNVDPATLGVIDIQAQATQLANTIALNLEQVAVFFPQKE